MLQRRPLIAGNWKMNGSIASVNSLLDELKRGCEHIEVAELAVLVPFVYLPQVSETLLRTQIAWGAQDVSESPNGAFTGDISAQMLVDFNCTYVLVVHSERRQYHGETHAKVAQKFYAALKAGLTPILCVGETEAQRDAQQTLKIIQEQLAAVFDFTDNHSLLQRVVVAYEPVWAIGTGRQATPAQAQEVHAAIRAMIAKRDSALAESLRIIYGGSMKPENAEGLLKELDVDGGLIGGASLHAGQFLEIGMKCNN